MKIYQAQMNASRAKIMSRKFGFMAVLILCLPAALQPAQAPRGSIFRANVDELKVPCIAQDANTAPVRGLTKESFSVLIDGTPSRLDAVGTDAVVPIDVALLVDVSLSQKAMQGLYVEVIHTLAEQLTSRRDKISVYTFGRAIRLLRDWEDAAVLKKENIIRIDPNEGLLIRKGPKLLAGTLLFDAIAAAAKRFGSGEGRKSILILTDGVDEGSITLSGEALTAAGKQGASISALEFSLAGVIDPAFLFKKVHDSLQSISRDSGGIFLPEKAGREKTQIQDIIEGLKQEYLLFVKPPQLAPGKHTLVVRLNNPAVKTSLRYPKRVWAGTAPDGDHGSPSGHER